MLTENEINYMISGNLWKYVQQGDSTEIGLITYLLFLSKKINHMIRIKININPSKYTYTNKCPEFVIEKMFKIINRLEFCGSTH